ncbi:MAG: ubiquitin-like small modifier protein 1 [Halobacteria archaeon]|nr:ubiquitin-like small modifier protein 1 [Halobacteria archaeon]
MADTVTVTVGVRLFADLAETVGENKIELRVESESSKVTVGEAVDSLVSEYPDLEDRILDSNGIRRHINLLVNGDDAGPQTPVEDGDELGVFPPVSGG